MNFKSWRFKKARAALSFGDCTSVRGPGTQHPERLLAREHRASRCYQSIADTFVQLFQMGAFGVMASALFKAIEGVHQQLECGAMSLRRMGWRWRWSVNWIVQSWAFFASPKVRQS